MRLEIAERRSREESDLGHPFDLGRQGKRCGEIGGNRINAKLGKILAQAAGLRVQEVAGNVDRDIGAEIAALQQQADLGGGAGAEFHQCGALRNDGSDLVAAAAQNAELGAGRIIFRQDRDLLEQLRACGVVEIFRRQTLGKLRQVADHVAGKGGGLLIELVRLSQSGGMHIHDTLLNALSGAL